MSDWNDKRAAAPAGGPDSEATPANGPDSEAAPAGRPDSEPAPAALPGLRILDFSRVLAGPFATMLLADLGAEVIKVERPRVGDETRAWGPPFDARGQSTYFDAVNRNKRSVALDLGTPGGLERATALAGQADVLVENFRPGLLEGFGLGYAQLRKINPGLIYCSITGFGSTPAGAALPGYDLLVQALGGLMSITGERAGEPQKVGVALVDVLAGLFSTVGILAALHHRQTTGDGQLIEVDLLSSLLAALVNQSAGYTVAGIVPERMGNEHPSIAPYAVFPTGDGRLVLAVGNDRQFEGLCDVLGDTALARDPRFASNPERVANREALRGELERRLAARSAEDWAAGLTAARIPAGVVNDVASAFALAQNLGLNPIVELADDRTTLRLPRNPIRLQRTPATYRLAPPELRGVSLES